MPSTTRTVIDPVTGLPTETSTTSDSDAEQRDALSAAAQQARVRSDAALAGFREGAPKEARSSFDATVAGPEVNSAEKYLAGLTDEPTLSDGDLRTGTKRLEAALSARVDAMRGAESALYAKRVQSLEQLRDDDVTALEIRIAVLGALVLLAVGIATALARTLTRPLSVLRRGSARLAGAEDPTAEEPVAFTGRNDEFAQVVRSVNALHTQAATLAGRVATLESDRKHLVGQRQKMADAREELRAELAESTARLDVVRKSIGSTFVNLALRTLGLVERQLAVIESLEEREQDPDRLATLFKLDHFATVMRRHSENLLVLAGTEHVQHSASPVPLVDVVRAAVSEIERYERVRIAALPPHAHVAGFAADDLSHLLAELMENATSFSPPDLPVEVSGWLLENGEVMLSVQDEGIGMATERLQRLNARLTEFDPEAPYEREGESGEDGLGLGLYVVARLAHRHGARVRLREQKQGGVAAVVVLPSPLLAAAPPAALAPTVPVSDGTGSFSLPGAGAEANSNVLHGRAEKAERADSAGQGAGQEADGPRLASGTDPLVASAEEAVRRAEAETAGDAPRADVPHAGTAHADTAHADTAHADTAPHRPTEPDEREDPAGAAAPEPAPETRPSSEDSENGEDPEGKGSEDAPAPGRDLPDDATMALFLPALAEPETRPAPAADPYAIGPDAHDRVPDPTGTTAPDPQPFAPEPDAPRPTAAPRPETPEPDAPRQAGSEPDRPEPQDRVTDKGLPKRTPKLTTPAAVPRPRTSGSVDADALRRRLGGFRRGAEAGRRDVEAEIADRTGQNRAPDAADTTEEATGGTVEEASS
ncbi:Signal transduction histidine-protein kinase/phosphatase MprB OS=Streptomyces tendae OX=1932 GN=GUR47_14420 PE=4 SV=1 [Streptomyces tendae]